MLANGFIFVNSLNSSSRLVAHSALSMSVPLLQVLCRSEVAERLMWANRVVEFFPLPQFAIQRDHFQRAVRHLVDLFGVGPLGALDSTFSFGELLLLRGSASDF